MPSFPFQAPKLVPLVLEEGKEGIYCSIEFLEADHCAGAAMILLRGYFGTFLLTGDFRFSSSMVSG